MKFTQTFIAGTLEEAVDYMATRLSQNRALQLIAENGSCTLEEAQNMYELSHRILSEGSEDIIPETLEIPDATDDDTLAAQDAEVDAEVAAAGGEVDEDLDLAELEGIILPDSEGNQYIIQGGILVPYTEEDDNSVMASGDEEESEEEESEEKMEESSTVNSDSVENIEENTTVENSQNIIEENTTYAAHSSIIANLLKNSQFN